MNVAILGMGRMGQAVASRLLGSGHDVSVWNRSPGKAEDVKAAGANEQDTIRDAVEGADIALVSLANDDAVRAVALGDDGLRSCIGDAVYVEASTISPALSVELAGTFEKYVAMPIVGSPDTVRSGKAIYLPGGDPETIQALDPILADLSANRHDYPEPALANVAKLTGNALLLTTIVGLAESIAIGRSGGLSDDQLKELLQSSPIIGEGTKNRLQSLIEGTGPAWWDVTLGLKDAKLALDIGSETFDLPLVSTVASRYAEADARGFADEDIAAVSHLYDR